MRAGTAVPCSTSHTLRGTMLAPKTGMHAHTMHAITRDAVGTCIEVMPHTSAAVLRTTPLAPRRAVACVPAPCTLAARVPMRFSRRMTLCRMPGRAVILPCRHHRPCSPNSVRGGNRAHTRVGKSLGASQLHCRKQALPLTHKLAPHPAPPPHHYTVHAPPHWQRGTCYNRLHVWRCTRVRRAHCQAQTQAPQPLQDPHGTN